MFSSFGYKYSNLFYSIPSTLRKQIRSEVRVFLAEFFPFNAQITNTFRLAFPCRKMLSLFRYIQFPYFASVLGNMSVYDYHAWSFLLCLQAVPKFAHLLLH